jgi:hypothetical protein
MLFQGSTMNSIILEESWRAIWISQRSHMPWIAGHGLRDDGFLAVGSKVWRETSEAHRMLRTH